jgi:F-type H+-transporting ATPase subunit epsilon
MRLRVFLPTEVLLDESIDKLSAEGEDGAFTLLPRHVGYVTSLVPGLLAFTTEGRERFLAIDGGILVKRGDEVRVSTGNAVVGAGLGELRRAVEQQFRRMDERERKAQTSLMRLEADFLRRVFELESDEG